MTERSTRAASAHTGTAEDAASATPVEGAPAGQGPPDSAWVAQWERSEMLDMLRTVLDTSHRVHPALARRAGLTQTEVAVLEHVMETPVGPSELAARLGVTTAAMSGIVDRLQGRGHVERRPHPTDRRRTAVLCTASGREELMGHLMPMFLELARIDAGMSDQERDIVLRFLTDANRAIGRLL